MATLKSCRQSWLIAIMIAFIASSFAFAGNKGGQQGKDSEYKAGLAAHYYKDDYRWGGRWLDGHEPDFDPSSFTFTNYAYTRKEPLINHFFIRRGWFSVRWQGWLDTHVGQKKGESAAYTLHVWADDGCRLYLDGKMVIDSWIPAWEKGAKSHREVTVSLTPGRHRIRIEYFQGASLKKDDRDPIKLYWACPSRKIKQHIIPAAHFSHTVEDLVPKPGRKD